MATMNKLKKLNNLKIALQRIKDTLVILEDSQEHISNELWLALDHLVVSIKDIENDE